MFKIRTREPGPVLGNLDLNKTLVGDLYSGFTTYGFQDWSISALFEILISKC